MTRVTKENDRYVMQRAEDRSFFAAFDYYTTKYKLLIWLLGLALLAIGFDFKTPKAIFQDLQAQITANKRQVDSVITPRIDNTDKKIDVLISLQCFNRAVTTDQKTLSGLWKYCPSEPQTEKP